MHTSEPGGADDTIRGKVLCIEDSPINMFLVETAVAAFPGVTLLKASTGAEGIALARSARPDLVLLDMHLPDIGGLHVVRAIGDLLSDGHMRITLLTADRLSMDIVKALSLGASDYWLKPLSLSSLRDRLRAALGARHG